MILLVFQPVLVKVDAVHVGTMLAERVNIAVALSAPIHKLDAQLERPVRRLQKLCLGDAQHGVEIDDVGNGCLADADGPDLFGFDQANPGSVLWQYTGKGCRRHPAGGSTADNDDTLRRLAIRLRHGASSRGTVSAWPHRCGAEACAGPDCRWWLSSVATGCESPLRAACLPACHNPEVSCPDPRAG